jgi:DNA-binding GntR family transcriptional regulator
MPKKTKKKTASKTKTTKRAAKKVGRKPAKDVAGVKGLRLMQGQPVTLEQRLVARAIVATEKDHKVVAEQVMPLDVTPKQAIEALKEVGKPPSNSRLFDPFEEYDESYENDNPDWEEN